MTFSKYLERLRRMDQLIHKQATGDTNQFASKMGICRSVLLEHIKEMKLMGAPIAYSRRRGCYYYYKTCSLTIEFIQNKYEKF